MAPPSLASLAVAVALLTAIMAPGRPQMIAATGLALFVFGLASLSVNPGLPPGDLPAWAPTAAGSVTYLRGTAGIVLAGLALLGIGGSRSPLILGVLAAALVLRPLFLAAGVVPGLLVGGLLLAALAIAGYALVHLQPGRLFRSLDVRTGWHAAPTVTVALLQRDRVGQIAMAAGVLAVLVPDGLVMLAAAVVTGLLAHLAAQRLGLREGWPVLPILGVALLGAIGYLVVVSEGGTGFAALGRAQIDAEGARLLVLLLALGAAGLAGLWPLHGVTPGPVLAPVAAVLIGRLGMGAAPAGVEHWQALLLPVLLLGVWHAVSRGQVHAALTAAGLFGVWTATEAGIQGGFVLVFCGLLMTTGLTIARGIPVVLRRAARVVPAWGVFRVLEGGLAAEVVWTVLLAASGAVLAAAYVFPRRDNVAPAPD